LATAATAGALLLLAALLLLLLLPLSSVTHQASTKASILQMAHQKMPWKPEPSFLCLLRGRDTCKRCELRELGAFATLVQAGACLRIS
jgi:hypothetical protein